MDKVTKVLLSVSAFFAALIIILAMSFAVNNKAIVVAAATNPTMPVSTCWVDPGTHTIAKHQLCRIEFHDGTVCHSYRTLSTTAVAMDCHTPVKGI